MSGVDREKGFTLVSAVFIFLVLAVAASVIVEVSSVQRATSDFALAASRTYAAARSGIEWAVAYLKSTSATSCTDPPFPAGTGAQFSLGNQLLTVSCSASQHVVDGQIFTFFNLVSIAEFPSRGDYGNADYVQRKVQAVVKPN